MLPFFNPAWPFHRRARDERALVESPRTKREGEALFAPDAPVEDPLGSEAWFNEDLNLFDLV